jgi:hypothetical protein
MIGILSECAGLAKIRQLGVSVSPRFGPGEVSKLGYDDDGDI